MKTQSRLPALAVALVAALAGCTTYQTTRDTTQPSKLQKAAFADGPWYTLRTVIDAPYEAGFTFIGEAGNMEKIQWDIQENYLYAYKTYEYVQGTDATAKQGAGDHFRGEPVAAYKIESHFDLWHHYNAITGEETPVLYEATERPWYEREYFRVDWSENLSKSFQPMGSELCNLDGSIAKSPVAYAPNKPGDPQAVYFGQRNADGSWKNTYDLTQTQHLSSIDYIDVINREFAHVNIGPLLGNSPQGPNLSCIGYPYVPLTEDMQITYRVSFLKMDKQRFAQFEPVYYPDPSFEKFGFFRDERLHYDANRGVTDFMGYQMHRWNIWEKSKDETGKTIPLPDRQPRKLVYYINDEAPDNFKKIAADEIAGQSWNLSFQGALKAAGWKGDADHTPMFEIHTVDNTCGLDGKQPCQQHGDLRYSFANYVSRPNMGSPLGYGPSFSDPETGEIINATANFYGAALNTMRGFVGDVYDLTENPGSETENSILTGESVRQYFQGLGNVIPPTFPNVHFDPNLIPNGGALAASGQFNLASFSPKLMQMKGVFDAMKRDGPGYRYSGQSLKGSPIEKMAVEADGYLKFFGFQTLDEIDPAYREQILDQISPFRRGDLATNYARITDFWSRGGTWSTRDGVPTQGCALPDEGLFDDASIPTLVAEARDALSKKGLDDLPNTGDEITNPQKGDVIDWIMLHTYRGVEEHEIGHTFGLRHNFEGTADEENYQPDYWKIANDPELALPKPTNYDADGDGTLQYDEWQNYLKDYQSAHSKQAAAGVNFHEYSSIMDYSQHFYYNDIHGIGKYDDAAIKFGYAGTVEAYKADVPADKSGRIDVGYFLGGETCRVSSDCPDHKFFGVNGTAFAQHCRGSVKNDGIKTPTDLGHGWILDTDEDESKYAAATGYSGGVCSDVYTELSSGDVVNDTSLLPTGDVAPVSFPKFRFCSDERVPDRPFCTRYDEGRNAVEVVQNQVDEYKRNYIFSNFRRYRYNFGFGYGSRVFSRYYAPLGKIYQSMLYQLIYDPAFALSPDKGFSDFLQASVISLNFFGQVLAEPAVGQFQQLGDLTTPPDQPRSDRQMIARWTGNEICDPTRTNDIQPCLGLGYGKYLWSSWERGYFGIDRQARVGTFFDKLYALEALSTRYWGFPRFSDETYPINFYDGFHDEVLQMFGGMATENLPAYASVAKVDDNGNVSSVAYRNFWTGKFFNNNAADYGIAIGGLRFGCDDPKGQACQGMVSADFPEQLYTDGYRPVDPGGSFILRLQSLIDAVITFSPYYDQTFQGYVQLSVFGQGDPRADGLQDAVNKGLMVQYPSPKFNKLYTASTSSDGRSFTAQMVRQASDLANLHETYLKATNLGPLNDDPRCKLRGETNETCRKELVDSTQRDLDSTETLLNYTDYLLTALGVH